MIRYRVIGYDHSTSSGEMQEDIEGAFVFADEAIAEIVMLRKALESIAKSYPTTDEGEALAALARDALDYD